jgi:hypothetical protein
MAVPVGLAELATPNRFKCLIPKLHLNFLLLFIIVELQPFLNQHNHLLKPPSLFYFHHY